VSRKVRSLKVLVSLAALTVALAVASACGDEENGPQPVTPGSASTIPALLTATPAGTPVATVEPRPTLTPGAYEPPAGSANVFGNPGLEEGSNYWFALHDQTVQTSSTVAHSGQASAYLKMRDSAEATGPNIYYLVQEVDPAEFPEMISGYYRVENWKRGTLKQYLQFVVIVFAPTNLGTAYPNYQIRYPLAGISEDPFPISNAYFIYLGKEEPRQGEWVYFETNIKNDFLEKWEAVPAGYSKIRVLFEVRYDDKEVGLPAEADVYYDDLYMGPAASNPNTP